jgi:hypothetical protein
MKWRDVQRLNHNYTGRTIEPWGNPGSEYNDERIFTKAIDRPRGKKKTMLRFTGVNQRLNSINT